jgi:hypothetical protein
MNGFSLSFCYGIKESAHLRENSSMLRVSFFMLLLACNGMSSLYPMNTNPIIPNTVNEIPLPDGFSRVRLADNTFGSWLRKIKLKSDNTVYLYDGRKKSNQSAQFAVLAITVGTKDLQQCADAVMRLRAEYLRSAGRGDEIAFHATDGTLLDYRSWRQGYRFFISHGKLSKRKIAAPGNSPASFHEYLDLVFTYCGTLSLSKELKSIPMSDIAPGDVWIKGGSPGHAAIVMDVAVNSGGQKQFLLAQSYMPAQDIHILRNPLSSENRQPWFELPGQKNLYTPQWIFKNNELMRFE